MPAISGVITEPINQNAGERNPSNQTDTTTCFGIPGSGLPRRHCNVNIKGTVLVCSDTSVYLSIHSGEFSQNVFGRGYSCKMFASPHPFNLYIRMGASGWKDVQFTHASTGKTLALGKDIFEIADGEVNKEYENTTPFIWKFEACKSFSEGQEVSENQIISKGNYSYTYSGGSGRSNSKFTNMGKLTDYGWIEELGDSSDGTIWLCGGIIYSSGSVIDSDITAVAVPITFHGLNTFFYYYPGDTLIGGSRKSLNRPHGYFRMKTSHSSVPAWKVVGGWRDCKNCDDDSKPNSVFLLDGGEWKRAQLTGSEK